jgi:zinc transporter, ZIP family
MPLFDATGSRRKAFFAATVSGLKELVGAFIGWIVLLKVCTQGHPFAVVAGIMMYISVKELLPTAHRYNPEDKVSRSPLFLVINTAIMALSLVLFVV